MARVLTVYPPVHLAKVPVSSIITMHDGLLRDCERILCLLQSITRTKYLLLLIYNFLLLQPIPIYSEVFNIVIEPCFVLDSNLSHIHETLSLAVYF